MSASQRQWAIHLGLCALAASLSVLVNDSDGISQHDLLDALKAAVIYLTGALMKSPADVREPDAATRSTDART